MRPYPARSLRLEAALFTTALMLASAPSFCGSAAGQSATSDSASAGPPGSAPPVVTSAPTFPNSDSSESVRRNNRGSAPASANVPLNVPAKTGENSSTNSRPSESSGQVEYRYIPLATVYSDDMPAGVIRTVRIEQRDVHDGHVRITVTTTRYVRPHHGLPVSWIVIPRIGVRARLVEGVSQAAMAEGPGHFPQMALPGEAGNCGVAAHSNVPGCAYFRYLNRLRPGDHIFLETEDDTYSYTVTNLHVVRPNDVRDLQPTPFPRLTLVTCTLPDARNRLIVVAVGNGGSIDGGFGRAEPERVRMPVAGRRHVAQRRHYRTRRR